MYLLHHKSNTINTLQDYLNSTLKEYHCWKICSDQGGEFTSNVFCKELSECGITHKVTSVSTPELNGSAEHLNRTLMAMVHAYLSNSGLDKSFWGEAMWTAVYILNCIPDKQLSTTPFKVWTNLPLHINHIHTFRCCIHILTIHNHSLLTNQTRSAIYLSPASETSHLHQLLINDTSHIIETHNTIFQENVMPARGDSMCQLIDAIKPPKVVIYKAPLKVKLLRCITPCIKPANSTPTMPITCPSPLRSFCLPC